jgi:retinol dehydrogenase-12
VLQGSIFVANEFARRYADQGIVSCSLNPGNIRTELARHTDPVTTFFLRRIQHPAPLGALTMLWAGTSPEGLQLNGKVLHILSACMN